MLQNFINNIEVYLYLIPVILVSLTFHEFSHAYVSYRLGDPTAKMQGRLTLNPLKHLDFLGTLMMLVARIGWAKPVPINPMYYKDRKKGTILVSIAGPISNLILSILFSFVLSIIIAITKGTTDSELIRIIYEISFMFFYININLAIFNLIPIPPLDGSKILSGVLPPDKYFSIMRYERQIGLIFLVIVLVAPGILSSVIGFIATPITISIRYVTEMIVGIFF